MKRALSGIQSSGQLTIGNYIGAIRNYVRLQEMGYECFYMVVDLHAITQPQEPEALRENTESAIALFLASGLDPNRSAIFLQSHVPAHAELGWLMTTLTYMGELERMTQFKDKSEGKGSVGVGLFTYPSLMAADIMLYKAAIVPVGDDQKQHLELTRDLVGRFNNRFGDTLTVPEPYTPEVGARIMSLDDASKKMSKSNPNAGSYILMLDEPDVIRKKISRAVTDSGREVKYDPQNKPEISNLISIYTQCSDLSVADIEAKYEGLGYGPFKKDLAEVVVALLEPIQVRYRDIRSSGQLHDVLRKGASRASAVADQTLREVKDKMGFVLPS
jgi:tryptophanyl-tRNA synthetase